MAMEEEESHENTPETSPAGVRRVSAWKRWAETIALSSVAPLVGLFVAPDDPFFVNAPFSWPLLAVVTVGLRYGLSSAYAAGAITLLGALNCGGPTPSAHFVAGLVLLTLLAGEFGHRTGRRSAQAIERTRLAERRASVLLARHQALAASHTLLERSASSTRGSLREALEEMGRRFGDSLELDEANAHAVLELFAEFGDVSAASFLLPPADNDSQPQAIATLGQVDPVSRQAPLVRSALESRKVAAVGSDGPQPHDERLLAVVPLFDSDGKLHAIVAIQDMPFLAFHDEALQLFATLGGHLADLLADAGRPREEASAAAAFARSLKRSLADLKTLKLPATVVRATASGPDAQAVLSLVEKQRRSVDRVLKRSPPDDNELVFLLPMTDAQAAETCRRRMENAVALAYPEKTSDTRCLLETIPLTANDEPSAILGRPPEEQHVVARRFGA